MHNSSSVPDLQTVEDPDVFKLICKASSEQEGWMKSTKAMQVGDGCIIQVSTQQRSLDGSAAIAEALTYVPGVTIGTLVEESDLSRQMINQGSSIEKITVTIRGVDQTFRWIPPGEFLMGSPVTECERVYDEVQHEVTISKGFWMADTACTQALWEAVMGDNPSMFKGSDNPVDTVSWNTAMEFIEEINTSHPDLTFRLPTEAEWEYACRAGTTTPFSFGESITPEQVNYGGKYPYAGGKKGEYRKKTMPVKSFPCNAWGLYEMHGNVSEWCSDWYGDYSKERLIDPKGPDTGDYRVLRGGSWDSYGRYVRSAYREGRPPDSSIRRVLGFRLVMTEKEREAS